MKKPLIISLTFVILLLLIKPVGNQQRIKQSKRRKLTHKLPIEDQTKFIEQKVKVTKSALTKANLIQDEEEKLVEAVIKIEEFNKVNNTVKETFLEKSKEVNSVEKFVKTQEYAESLDFNKALKEEFKKLHPDNLKPILEIDGHPIEEKINANEEQNRKLIDQIMKGELEDSNSPEKQKLSIIFSMNQMQLNPPSHFLKMFLNHHTIMPS